MINRILIRIKVLQILFAYYQNGEKNIATAEKELMFSLKKSYDLYHYLLLLINEVTYLQERIIDNRRHKYLPTEKELNPNMRFINNRFATQLAQNESLLKYTKDESISWSNDTDFTRNVLDLIKESDLYTQYMNSDDTSFEADREFWRATFKHVIGGSEFVYEYLEDKCLYWNEDIDIVETFVLKTIKRFDEKKGAKQPLLPMYKDEEDIEFARTLFRLSIEKGREYRDIINDHLKNWETERVANMDLLLMQIALTEILNFPTIPLKVTLNEYIDAAKTYSTPKSGTFINGILDSVVKDLKNKNLLFKN